MGLGKLASHLQVATKQRNNRENLRYLPGKTSSTQEVKLTEVRQVPSEI